MDLNKLPDSAKLTPAMESVSAKAFRDAMACLAAAVVVVTTDGPKGRCGITATSFCSVSDAPPTGLVCVKRSSAMNTILKGNGQICINVLTRDQVNIARQFSGQFSGTTVESIADRFVNNGWKCQDDQTLPPILPNAVANLYGKIIKIEEVGTHSVVFFIVEHVNHDQSLDALIYLQRHYRDLSPRPAGAELNLPTKAKNS